VKVAFTSRNSATSYKAWTRNWNNCLSLLSHHLQLNTTT